MEGKIAKVEEVDMVAKGNTEFGGRLYDLLREDPGNIIMSAFSVSAVMAMASSGAGGETLAQMTSGMSFPSTEHLVIGYRDVIAALGTDNSNFTLEVANIIFGQEELDILPAFEQTLVQHFGASIQKTDFRKKKEAALLINNWVEKVTREKIRNNIQPDMLDSLSKLVLVNAIYFKGDWAKKFDPECTENRDFYLADGRTVSVPMMTHTRKYQMAKIKNLDAAMIELPFKADRIVMQILLPKNAGGLRELEGKMQTEDLETLFQEKKKEEWVKLFLPRFKLEQTIPLTSLLKQLGMTDMFLESRADFSGIDGSEDLFVSNVLQKAVIEVTEEGSEVAAVTVCRMQIMGIGARKVKDPEFRADHPFMFFLRDRLTGLTLFQRRVQDPTAKTT